MQRGVGGDQAFDIALGERFDALLLQLPEPFDVLGLRVLGGELGRVGLQDRADAEQLGGLLLGGGVHEGALGGTEVDPAVGLEALEGFADRLAADTEVFGEFGFDEVLAGLEGAADDQFGQRVVDGLAQRCRAGDAPGRSGCECLAHGSPVLPPGLWGRRLCQVVAAERVADGGPQHTGFGMQDGVRGSVAERDWMWLSAAGCG